MCLGVGNIHRFGNTRDLVKLPGIVPKVIVIDQPTDIALKVGHINRVEPDQRREEAPVGLGYLIAD